MARCPHCNYKLQLIDVRAECPVCGVNIPNYNWEGRLEEDAVNAEKSFASFRKRMNAFKSSLFGNKFRIARFVLTFAPLIFLLIPMIKMNVNLPFGGESEYVSVLTIILDFVNGNVDLGSMISFMSLPKSGTAFILLYVSLALVVLAIVAAVINFVVLIIAAFGYHAKGNMILCALSIVFTAASVVTVLVSSSMFSSSIPEVMSISLSFGLFAAIIFFAVNFAMNYISGKQFKKEKAAVNS
ncbi:MAG: hypothetical protein LUG85_00595 [Clostridiales bacterium]|nr:hypothetical protein [Clostridiales bacterium]